jgi:glycosyltransferase involved in cell wall biosynthesis
MYDAPRVAIIHDWLTGMRGGEKVLAALAGIFPGADIFTLFYRADRVNDQINSHRIFASPLNRWPGVLRYYRNLLPLMPRAIESFDLQTYDLVISSSHAVAKGARVPAGVPHICYCHTPMRYLWAASDDYFQYGVNRLVRRPALGLFAPWLRRWDVRASQGVTQFLANSENVRGRIAHAYGREARVVYPPVDTDFFTPDPAGRAGEDYYLVVSALEPYKRIDLAIRAMQRLGRRLVVAGRGTQAATLQRIAGPGVEFTGWVDDERLRQLYRGCRALLFPGLEDFGMCPVEAQACGRPVIAYGRGGALESVNSRVTGLFFSEQTVDSIVNAVEAFEMLDFDPAAARRNSLRFSPPNFEAGIRACTRACNMVTA